MQAVVLRASHLYVAGKLVYVYGLCSVVTAASAATAVATCQLLQCQVLQSQVLQCTAGDIPAIEAGS